MKLLFYFCDKYCQLIEPISYIPFGKSDKFIFKVEESHGKTFTHFPRSELISTNVILLFRSSCRNFQKNHLLMVMFLKNNY